MIGLILNNTHACIYGSQSFQIYDIKGENSLGPHNLSKPKAVMELS